MARFYSAVLLTQLYRTSSVSRMLNSNCPPALPFSLTLSVTCTHKMCTCTLSFPPFHYFLSFQRIHLPQIAENTYIVMILKTQAEMYISKPLCNIYKFCHFFLLFSLCSVIFSTFCKECNEKNKTIKGGASLQ